MTGKKKLKAINSVSVMHDVLVSRHSGRDIGGSPWFYTAPDMWSKEETELYDTLIELETKLKEEVLKILQS